MSILRYVCQCLSIFILPWPCLISLTSYKHFSIPYANTRTNVLAYSQADVKIYCYYNVGIRWFTRKCSTCASVTEIGAKITINSISCFLHYYDSICCMFFKITRKYIPSAISNNVPTNNCLKSGWSPLCFRPLTTVFVWYSFTRMLSNNLKVCWFKRSLFSV